MPFGLVWFGQALWYASRVGHAIGLQCLSAWSGLVRPRLCAGLQKPGELSPMPFGLVWFGQGDLGPLRALAAQKVSNAFRLGLVWSDPQPRDSRPHGAIVSNAFRLGLVWSANTHETH